MTYPLIVYIPDKGWQPYVSGSGHNEGYKIDFGCCKCGQPNHGSTPCGELSLTPA